MKTKKKKEEEKEKDEKEGKEAMIKEDEQKSRFVVGTLRAVNRYGLFMATDEKK